MRFVSVISPFIRLNFLNISCIGSSTSPVFHSSKVSFFLSKSQIILYQSIALEELYNSSFQYKAFYWHFKWQYYDEIPSIHSQLYLTVFNYFRLNSYLYKFCFKRLFIEQLYGYRMVFSRSVCVDKQESYWI